MTEELELNTIQQGLQARIRKDVLAELHASGGLPQGRITLEFLYLMPQDFIDAYTSLFWQALHEEKPVGQGVEGEGSVAGEGKDAMPKLKTQAKQKGIALGSENRLQATGGKRYKTYWTVRDEKALRLKSRVDTKLRELAGMMRRSGMEVEIRILPCGQCGKFMRGEWRFCPGCGNNLGPNSQ